MLMLRGHAACGPRALCPKQAHVVSWHMALRWCLPSPLEPRPSRFKPTRDAAPAACARLPPVRAFHPPRPAQVSEEVQLAKEDEDEAKVAAQEFFFPKGTKVYVKVRTHKRTHTRTHA